MSDLRVDLSSITTDDPSSRAGNCLVSIRVTIPLSPLTEKAIWSSDGFDSSLTDYLLLISFFYAGLIWLVVWVVVVVIVLVVGEMVVVWVVSVVDVWVSAVWVVWVWTGVDWVSVVGFFVGSGWGSYIIGVETLLSSIIVAFMGRLEVLSNWICGASALADVLNTPFYSADYFSEYWEISAVFWWVTAIALAVNPAIVSICSLLISMFWTASFYDEKILIFWSWLGSSAVSLIWKRLTLEKPYLQFKQFWVMSLKVKLKTVGMLVKTNENFWTDHLSRLSL